MGIEDGSENKSGIEMIYPEPADLLDAVDVIKPEEQREKLWPILEMLRDSNFSSELFLRRLLDVINGRRQKKMDPLVRDWYQKVAGAAHRGLKIMPQDDQRYLTRKKTATNKGDRTKRRF